MGSGSTIGVKAQGLSVKVDPGQILRLFMKAGDMGGIGKHEQRHGQGQLVGVMVQKLGVSDRERSPETRPGSQDITHHEYRACASKALRLVRVTFVRRRTRSIRL